MSYYLNPYYNLERAINCFLDSQDLSQSNRYSLISFRIFRKINELKEYCIAELSSQDNYYILVLQYSWDNLSAMLEFNERASSLFFYFKKIEELEDKNFSQYFLRKYKTRKSLDFSISVLFVESFADLAYNIIDIKFKHKSKPLSVELQPVV